ncbi:MAG: InlB B-repeat-containing protein, partial [Eubacteriales bacterium]|nr:InlB B-repeat-containing protein [Eubacteriales bacterium]
VCGMAKPDPCAAGHTWADGVCSVCGATCAHESYGEDGLCVVCGMAKPDPCAAGHTWADGVCSVCGATCAHESYGEDGLCVVCGMAKPDPCAAGHTWADGVCSVCGATCAHENYGEDDLCVVCGMAKPVEKDAPKKAPPAEPVKATPEYPTKQIGIYFDRDVDHPEATYVQMKTVYLSVNSQASFGVPHAGGSHTGNGGIEADLLSVSYSSADPSIVSIDETGIMTGVAAGTTTITIAVKVHDKNEDVDRSYEFEFPAKVNGAYTTLASQGDAIRYPDVHSAVAAAAATDTITIHGTILPIPTPDVKERYYCIEKTAKAPDGVPAYYYWLFKEKRSYDSCVIDGKDITVIPDPVEGGKLGNFLGTEFDVDEGFSFCTSFRVVNGGTLRLGSAANRLEYIGCSGSVVVQDGEFIMENVSLTNEQSYGGDAVIVQQNGRASIKDSSIIANDYGYALNNAGTIDTLENVVLDGDQGEHVLVNTGTIDTIKNLRCINEDMARGLFYNNGTIGTIQDLDVEDAGFAGSALYNDSEGVIGSLTGRIFLYGMLLNKGEIEIFEGNNTYIECHSNGSGRMAAIMNEGQFDSKGGFNITGGEYLTPKLGNSTPGPVIVSTGSTIYIEPDQTAPTGDSLFGLASQIPPEKILAGSTTVLLPDGYHMSRASMFDYRYIAKDAMVTYVYQDGETADFEDTEHTVETVGGMYDDDPDLVEMMTENAEYYTVISEEPEREGYIFQCWNTEPDGSGEEYLGGFQRLLTGDLKLYAQWKPLSFTITYDPNGGTLNGSTEPSVETHDYGEEITISPAPSREGYTFQYWKGSEYQPGDSYTVTEDHTFTAQWEKNPEPSPEVTPTPTPAPTATPAPTPTPTPAPTATPAPTPTPTPTPAPTATPAPTPTPSPAPANSPKTGDNQGFWRLGVLTLFALLGGGMAVAMPRKKGKHSK